MKHYMDANIDSRPRCGDCECPITLESDESDIELGNLEMGELEHTCSAHMGGLHGDTYVLTE